jgi:hypothetical protein
MFCMCLNLLVRNMEYHYQKIRKMSIKHSNKTGDGHEDLFEILKFVV